jgi:hypothetical protein
MEPEQKERYVRWQNYRITQLSFSINLFLSFAVASLAYVINMKLSSNSQNPDLLVFIIKWWSWSAGLGCLATISRLLDFRYTAKKIKFGGKFNTFMAKWLGPATWVAFWGQLLTYIGGAYCFISGIINT